MNPQVIVIIAVVTAYLVWLIIFLLIVERWLRRLVEWLLGIRITREFQNVPSQNVSLLDGLFLFSWKVAEPAALSVRFAVGFLRISFWLIALAWPVVMGFVVYFWISRGH
ncbi:MAG TPA: hypothetical protein VKD91_05270 [Pyrinomonadaceae bacterium]|nr:hypothetical protein [Pyrinomonadaceae bacterium]